MGHMSWEGLKETRRERKGLMDCAHDPRSAEFKTELQADTFSEFDLILLLLSDVCFPSNSGIPFISAFTQSDKGLILGGLSFLSFLMLNLIKP